MNKYDEMINKNNGIIYASKLKDYNINRHILNELVANGQL